MLIWIKSKPIFLHFLEKLLSFSIEFFWNLSLIFLLVVSIQVYSPVSESWILIIPKLGKLRSYESYIWSPITSCLKFKNFSSFQKLSSIKSEIRKMTLFRLDILFAKSIAVLIEVRLLLFSKSWFTISVISLRTCFLPFLGGIYLTISSENNTKPTLSLFLIAENPRTLAISVPISLFW